MSTPLTPADPTLAKKALEMVRLICKGNGIKTENVTLKSFTGSVLKVPAHTYLEVKPVTRDRRIAGKQVVGQLTQGAAGTLKAIDDTIINALRQPPIRQQLLDILLRRPDKGFALPDNTTLSAEFLSKDFSWHEACQTCRGVGRSPCVKCQGQQREQCPQCTGKSMVPCTLCRGSGQITGQGGNMQPCNKCHGQRQVACMMCGRTGKIPCRQCGGQGSGSCTSCSGSGYFTHTTHMTPQIITHFDFDRTAMPTEIISVMDMSASLFAQKGHIKISAAPENTDPNILAIAYTMTFPYGDIVFALGKRDLAGKLMGYKSRLVHIPDFLEKLIIPGVRDLEQAAAGGNAVAAKIKKASRFRLIGHALLGAGSGSIRATTDGLMKKFPMGISRAKADKISKLADAATGNITRQPRIIGLGIGFIILTLLYAFYFLGTGRAFLWPLLPDARLINAVDLFILILGNIIATQSIRLTAANALRQALGHLLPADQRKKLIPKAGYFGLWAHIIGVCMFIFMVELTVHLEKIIPDWYAYLRNIF